MQILYKTQPTITHIPFADSSLPTVLREAADWIEQNNVAIWEVIIDTDVVDDLVFAHIYLYDDYEFPET